jgi:Protein of unknown function (DUF3489)
MMTHSDKTAVAGSPALTVDPMPRAPREGTKLATLITMLHAPEGATIAEIAAATGWQAHSVRGAMAGILKKKLGLTVTSAKIDGRGRVYALASAQDNAASPSA